MDENQVIKSIKYRIYPTELQKEMLKHWFGADRWIWNHLIKRVFNENYDPKDVSKFKLRDEILNGGPEFLRRDTRKEVTDLMIDATVNKFIAAHTKYCQNIKKSKRSITNSNPEKFKPKLKKRKENFESCVLAKKNANTIQYKEGYINITTTKFYGRQTFKTKKKMTIDISSIKLIYFKKDMYNKYYMVLVYSIPKKEILKRKDKVGIDMGMITYLTTYDGDKVNKYNISDKIHRINKRIQYYHNKICKSDPSSKRHKKYILLLNKICNKQSNVKKDFIEKCTTFLVENYNNINIEKYDFNFNKKYFNGYNKKNANLSPGLFLLRLQTKSKEYDVNTNIIPRGFPSTQTCSNCGNVKTQESKLSIKDRVYKCKECGYEEDRDTNAAKNIYKLSFE